MSNLWWLRLKQAGRLLKSAGIIYTLLAIFLTTAFWIKGIILLNEITWSTFAMGIAVFLTVIHLQRKDHDWVKLHFTKPIGVYLIDYFLLSLPLFVFYLVQGQFLHVLGLGLAIVLVAILPSKSLSLKNSPLQTLHKLFPLQQFEVKCAIKENPLFLILIFACTILAPLHISLLVIHLVLVQLLISQSFRFLEPKEIIHPSGTFLNQKFLGNFKLMLILSIPIYLISLTFHWSYAYFIPIHLVFLNLLLLFTIGHKYSSYRPGYILVQSNIQQSLFLLFMYLPGLILVCIIWSIRSYFKAKKNLDYYYA